MPENKKDVFVILAELKRMAAGISDTNPNGLPNKLVSLLTVGESINPDDFKKPWKPNFASPVNVDAPTPPSEVPPDIAKRYESLANTCTLVDPRIRLTDTYEALATSASISQTWDLIVNGANVVAPDPALEEYQRQQFETFHPRLKKTVTEDGEEVEVDTAKYKSYKQYKKKYEDALLAYTSAYRNAMRTPETANSWAVDGTIYISRVNSARDEWAADGYKDFIEEALDNLAAMGTDASARAIARAKKRFGYYGIATQGVIPVTSQYVEVFPSNWCEPDTGDDGWTDYEYSWSNLTKATEAETTAYSASGSVSSGFWNAQANVSHEQREEHNDLQVDKLEVSFSFAMLEINRPWLDTVLFDLNSWFLVGNYPKGSISTGRKDQVFPDTNAQTWLPIIPTRMIAIRNLRIKSSQIQEHFDFLKTQTDAGGSIGIGPFKLSGKYSHSKSNETFTAENEGEGLKIDGVQIIGWSSDLVQLSPKIDSPINN